MSNGRYAELNGLRMYYEVHGEGPPLVLLHGGLMTIDLSFGGLVGPLARTRRVVAPELQGHGRTPDGDRPLTVEGLADDVAALIARLRLGRSDLFGFSLGATVALMAALRHPEAVGRLVLASTAAWPRGWHPETQPATADPASRRMPAPADFRAMEEAYRAMAPDPDHFAAFAAKASAAVGAFPGWTPAALRALRSPALIVVGDTDFVRLEHAVELLDLLPDARLAVLPGCTHIEVTRRAAQLLPLIEPFLAP